MKCRIIHESSLRIRFKIEKPLITIQQADILLYYLEEKSYVKQAVVYERTNDVVVFFKNGQKDAVISAISKFDLNSDSLTDNTSQNSGRLITRQFQEKFVGNITLAVARQLFLPLPLRILYTVLKSTGYIIKGIKSLINGKLEVEVIDAISIGVSVIRRDFSTAGSIMFLLGLGSLLEEWTHKKSINDLARTMSLNIDKVWLKTDGADVLVPVSSIKSKDLIVVNMGNVIPFDGTVHSGEAMVNQASLTGESVPVAKGEGAYIYAGTVIEEGELIISVDAEAGSGRYDRIVKMIEESEKLKSDTEDRASNLADKLVPYSLLGTAFTYLLTRNIQKTLSVLMVDFSCALKFSIPLAVLSAMKEAGKYKATVKGGKYLEAIAYADTIVFDKTGTLTHACPTVEKVIVCAGQSERQMIKIAACLEEHFPHSVANAVVAYAKKLNISHREMHSHVEYVVAHGIASTIKDEKVIIGSYHFIFEDEHTEVAPEDMEIIENLDPQYSHLFLAIAGKLVAVIYISDPLRDEAAEVIAELKRLGIKKTVMITGDNIKTAEAAAEKAGVDEFYAGVLPEDKAAFIEKERKSGKTVIMVGDGINDSPALSAASCGVAIGDGAAIAKEIADITITAENLNELITLKKIANRLIDRIDSNYRFIIIFNTALILSGTAGILSPTSSALLHNMSTLGISVKSMTDLL